MKRGCSFILKLVSVFILFSSTSYALEYGFSAGFGLSYINSKGLNKVTEGLDSGYVTSFGKINFPLNFEGDFFIGFGNSSLGLGLGYEFTSRNSYSDVYKITQDLSYKSIPIFLKYRYLYFENNRFSMALGGSAGILYSKLSMSTRPSPQDSDVYGMKAWGAVITAENNFYYAVSNNIRFFSTVGLRYAKTGSFSYTSDTANHSSGEKVQFSDGSNLTLNLTGLKFLIGIMMNWS